MHLPEIMRLFFYEQSGRHNVEYMGFVASIECNFLV